MLTETSPLYTIYENSTFSLSDEPLIRNLTYYAWKTEMRRQYFQSKGMEYDPYMDLNFNRDFLRFVLHQLTAKHSTGAAADGLATDTPAPDTFEECRRCQGTGDQGCHKSAVCQDCGGSGTVKEGEQ